MGIFFELVLGFVKKHRELDSITLSFLRSYSLKIVPTKKRSSKLGVFSCCAIYSWPREDYSMILQSSALKINKRNVSITQNKKANSLFWACFVSIFCWFIRDLGRIQTCNLLSRNQMRYSVAPRGLFSSFKPVLLGLIKTFNYYFFPFAYDFAYDLLHFTLNASANIMLIR